MLLQDGVRFAEVTTTEEATMGTQGRRVRRGQDPMLAGINGPTLFLRVSAPEQEHLRRGMRRQRGDDPVRETFPTLALMAGW